MKITLKLCLAAMLLLGSSIMTWSVKADEGCDPEQCTMRSDHHVWCCALQSSGGGSCTYGNDTNWCYIVPGGELAD